MTRNVGHFYIKRSVLTFTISAPDKRENDAHKAARDISEQKVESADASAERRSRLWGLSWQHEDRALLLFFLGYKGKTIYCRRPVEITGGTKEEEGREKVNELLHKRRRAVWP